VSEATAIAHPNIALVKYWGKRDAALNLPAVPSLSLTLGGYRTRTTVTWGSARDEVVLDGEVRDDPKVARVLDLLAPGRPACRVVSDNDFPTGAGLASSASGFAALVVAAAAAAGLDPGVDALTALARRGSGSACRSLHGGFVEWPLGERADGADSVGRPVAPTDHWDVRLVVAVVSDARKAVGSTEGMVRSQQTSPYWSTWTAIGPGLVEVARAAVLARDLVGLGEAMETSTFAMHATMHTARPPLLYWQPATVGALHAVQALRRDGVAAYATMDAGPQVKVLCEPASVEAVREALRPHALRVEVHAPGGPARVEAPSREGAARP
jgi:diphosphomevalonate decarboxylase